LRRQQEKVEENEKPMNRQAIVYLVGAGPGDPGLLTLRGKECLEKADFVLYDQLVSPRLLDFAPADAEKLCVRELASCHPDRWPHIHVKLIEKANEGKCVVRLKGGDPLIFGRGGEEAEALRNAGIPYEIVPGVTAALGAGSYLEIPLTHRTLASAVAFVTGHEHPGKPSSRVDWKALAEFPGTLVVYMGFSRLGSIVPELIRHGKDPDTPTAAVMLASCAEQRTVTSTLRSIEEDILAAGLITPAVVIIGPVVGLRPAVSWFEARPLLGQRVLVTRPRHQAADMLRSIELLGAHPLSLSVIEIREPADWAPVDAVQESIRLGRFDWLVFTSGNGVEMFMNRLHRRGRDLRDLGSVKLAAIGVATAGKLRAFHLEPDLVPAGAMDSEHLVAELADCTAGRRVLLAQADRGREMLRERLSSIAAVESVAVYSQVDAVDLQSPVFDLLRRGEIDFVTLTSPNIATALLTACDATILNRLQRGDIHLASNSPRTSAAIRGRGMPVAVESNDPTMAALLDALVAFRQSHGK
jgi:uroporphyrinogen III methyltransferase/synthase